MRLKTVPNGISINDVVKIYPGISNHFDYGLLVIIQDLINKLDAVVIWGFDNVLILDKYGNEHSTAEILLKGEEKYQEQLNI